MKLRAVIAAITWHDALAGIACLIFMACVLYPWETGAAILRALQWLGAQT